PSKRALPRSLPRAKRSRSEVNTWEWDRTFSTSKASKISRSGPKRSASESGSSEPRRKPLRKKRQSHEARDETQARAREKTAREARAEAAAQTGQVKGPGSRREALRPYVALGF